MLFLLNDVVFKIDPPCPAPLHDERRFDVLDLDSVLELACDLYAEYPDLQHTHPERAHRIAWLLSRKIEGLNAALFTAPHAGCKPELVEPRFCTLPAPVIEALSNREGSGELTRQTADEMVWGLQAA